MKTLILAGGYGTRISEETDLKPKPMVEVGGRPILWHIMKIYSHFGFNDFVVLLGYKGYVIKEYFANYFLHQSDVTIDLAENRVEVHQNTSEPWRVTLLDTGLDTMTGGRIRTARSYIGDSPFHLTYGDGVADVRIDQLLAFHQSHGKLATMTSVQPEGRFGSVDLTSDGAVKRFVEKPVGDGGWINGGFFVCEPSVLDRIEGSETVFEKEPLESLAADDQLRAYRHDGFWKAMDTIRDKRLLSDAWDSGHAPWKFWS
jgi:glucose-1-phosphate cytidylyltransferase